MEAQVEVFQVLGEVKEKYQGDLPLTAKAWISFLFIDAIIHFYVRSARSAACLLDLVLHYLLRGRNHYAQIIVQS